jgi:hypothetical protein
MILIRFSTSEQVKSACVTEGLEKLGVRGSMIDLHSLKLETELQCGQFQVVIGKTACRCRSAFRYTQGGSGALSTYRPGRETRAAVSATEYFAWISELASGKYGS